MEALNQRVKKAIRDKTKPGGEWNKLLEQEAKRLYSMISAELASYYLSYVPTAWTGTTGNLLKSLRIRVSGSSFHIYFEPNLAYHPTINRKREVFLPTLIDAGWNYSARAHHFTYYEGYAFIEKAVKEFKMTTSLPISITIESKYYPEYYASF